MVNITILLHNRPLLAKQTLDSLWASGGNEHFNVLLFDDASENETAELAMDWADAHGQCLRGVLRNIGTGRARNEAIRLSEQVFGRGDYLYLSDSDVFFSPGWLPRLIDCYESAWSSGCRVLGAVGHPYHQQGDCLGVCSFNAYYGVYEVLAQPLQSMLMKWEVWDKYGPFKETPPGAVCQGEDCDFGEKIRADGGRLGVIAPPLLVNCGITNSFGQKIPGWELVQKEAPPGVYIE